MLGVAQRNQRALGLTNVDIVVGNVARLPLGESVDAAFTNMVLHHADNPAVM